MSDLLLQALEILRPLQTPEISQFSQESKSDGKMQAVVNKRFSHVSQISHANGHPPEDSGKPQVACGIHEQGQPARRVPSEEREKWEKWEKPANTTVCYSSGVGNDWEIKGNPEFSTTYRERTTAEWRAYYDQRVAARLAEAGGSIARDLAFVDCFDLIPKTIWPADRVDILTKAGIPKPATWFVGAPRATRDRPDGEAT